MSRPWQPDPHGFHPDATLDHLADAEDIAARRADRLDDHAPADLVADRDEYERRITLGIDERRRRLLLEGEWEERPPITARDYVERAQRARARRDALRRRDERRALWRDRALTFLAWLFIVALMAAALWLGTEPNPLHPTLR